MPTRASSIIKQAALRQLLLVLCFVGGMLGLTMLAEPTLRRDFALVVDVMATWEFAWSVWTITVMFALGDSLVRCGPPARQLVGHVRGRQPLSEADLHDLVLHVLIFGGEAQCALVAGIFTGAIRFQFTL